MAAARDDLPVLAFVSAADFDSWLATNHDSVPGVWLKLGKRGAGVPSVTYQEAVHVALCWGWIDGQTKAWDDAWWIQRFTPRRARSRWSRINRDRALALIESGRMQPAGLREVERARADGRWDAAYEPPSTAVVPDDFQAALDAEPAARDFWATLSGSNRFAVLYRIADAKRPETRARRIEQFVAMLREGRTLR